MDPVNDAVDGAMDAASDAYGTVRDGFHTGAAAAPEVARTVAHAAAHGIADAGHVIVEGAGQAWNEVAEHGGHAASVVGSAAVGATGVAATVGAQAWHAGSAAGAHALEAGSRVGAQALEVGSHVGAQALDVGSRVGAQALEVGSHVGAQVLDVGSRVGAQAVEVGSRVGAQALEVGSHVGTQALEVGSQVGEHAMRLGSTVAGHASELGAVVGERAMEAGSAAYTAGTHAVEAGARVLVPGMSAAVAAGTAAANVVAGEAAKVGGVVAAGLADAGEQTLDALLGAARAAPAYTNMAWSAASQGVDAVAPVLATAGATAAAAAGAVAGQAVQHGGEVIAVVAQGVDAARTAVMSWDVSAISNVYAPARAELAALAAVVSGAAIAVLDWVKIDVLRDQIHMISLFFGGLVSGALASAKTFFGNVSNFVSLDWFFTFQFNPMPMYIFIAVVAFTLMLCFFIMMCMSACEGGDAIRDGHEHEGWAVIARKRKRKIQFMRWVLIAAVSAYLPVARIVVQIFSCHPQIGAIIRVVDGSAPCTPLLAPTTSSDDPVYYVFKNQYVCDCKGWKNYGSLVVLACFLLIFYLAVFPTWACALVRKNRPQGSRENPDMRYDEDGKPIPYTNDLYQRDIMTLPDQQLCPYRVLYEGYERQWATYKIWIMFLKIGLIIPVIVWYDRIVVQGIVSLVLLLGFAALAMYSRPFVSPLSDTMDSAGRVSTFLTVLFGLIGSPVVAPGSSYALGVLVNIINAINFTVLATGTLYGIPAVRRVLKRSLGRFEFSDTVLNITGGYREVVATGKWDLRLETKHRIWHTFWQGVMLKSFGQEVADRFQELLAITADVGRQRIENHFRSAAIPGRVQWRQWIQSELEGVDVYWSRSANDGQLDSATRFGKMYVRPYPFQVVMVFDDSDDFAIIYDDMLDAFIQENMDPNIIAKKNVRLQLRALNGRVVHFEHQQMETKRVEDGVESYRDNEGKTRTRTRYSNIQVMMYYHNGTLSVGANTDKPWSAGFKVTVSYGDGHGSGVAPHTGQTHHFSNEHTLIGHGALGITPGFTMTSELSRLLGDASNASQVPSGMAEWDARCRAYRADLLQKRMREESILSSAFWLHIYDADTIPRWALERYFAVYETNPALRDLPRTHAAGLDYLYGRMSYARMHPCTSFWFVFFDDIWQCNPELLGGEPAKLLDPKNPDALIYRPMQRAQLEAILRSAGLRKKRALFSNGLVDCLYSQLQRLGAGDDLSTASSGMKTIVVQARGTSV